jgi:hypothetical protein
MRIGTKISAVGHGALIALAVFGLPWFGPRERETIRVTEVSFISEAEFEAAQAAASAQAPREETAPALPPPARPAPARTPEPEPEVAVAPDAPDQAVAMLQPPTAIEAPEPPTNRGGRSGSVTRRSTVVEAATRGHRAGPRAPK